MSFNAGTLPPSRSTVPLRVFTGIALSLLVGACSDGQATSPTAPASRPSAPAAARPTTSSALFSGYNANASAHYPHLRTQVGDYRISYQPAGASKDAEYLWTAQHYDRIVLDWGDVGSMPEYRRINPTAQVFRYALDWTVMQPTSTSAPNIAATYYPDMQAWYGIHTEYNLENAFLHRAGCGATQDCRVAFKIWNDDRWAVNPGDAGLRAYQRQRLATLVSDADGLFLDGHGSGDMDMLSTTALAEYPDYTAFQRDIVALLADERAALGGKKLSINNSTYITSWDADMVRAAGGGHGEYYNNPAFAEMEARWTFAEAALASGASMELTPAADIPATYTAGGYSSVQERRKLWELGSYYLVALSQPGLLFFNPNGSAWSQPFASSWFTAAEANVGLPTAARRIMAEGTDGSGRAYRVWSRDYANALVLVRPIISWSAQSYGDETAVSVTLPTDFDYQVLRGDGTLGPIVKSVSLRASESAILIKQAHVSRPVVDPVVTPPAPTSSPNPVLVVIDQDAVAIGTAPNWFSGWNLSSDLAAVGQRNELRYFGVNAGKSLTIYTGKMGGYEGVYAPRSIPAAWTAAGPTSNGLVNYFRAGPGLGSPNATGAREALLGSVGDAVPLRATGLKMLVGRTVCAVFMQHNAWVASFAPIATAFQGPNLGVAAFRVTSVAAYGSATSQQLPKMTITILSAASTCGGGLDPLIGAPAPVNPQLPFDVVP